MYRIVARFRLVALPVRRFSLPRDVKYDQGPSFYVLPEISTDMRKTVSVIDSETLPRIETVAPDVAFNAFSRMLVDYQLSLSKLSEGLKQRDVAPVPENFLHSLEEIFYPVEHGFQALHSTSSYNTDPFWPLILSRLYKKMKMSRTEYFYLDPEIYRMLLTSALEYSKFSKSQQAMLEVLLFESWRQGGALAFIASGASQPQCISVKKGKNVPTFPIPDLPSIPPNQAKEKLQRLRDTQAELESEEEQFQAMVLASSSVAGTQMAYSRFTGRYPNQSDLTYLTGAAHIPVAESDLAPSAPAWLSEALGGQQNGGHISDMRVNIAADNVVRSLLRHCSTRQVRQNVWLSWVQRSSVRAFGGGTGQHAANDSRMQNIRRLRRSVAEFLGYEDWLSLMWSSPYAKMPSSAESLISNVLEPLRVELKPVGHHELQMLSEWSSAHLDLEGTKLESWDIDYAIEQYNYAASHAQLQSTIIPPEGQTLSEHIYTLLDRLANLFHLRLSRTEGLNSERPLYRLEDMDDGSFLGELILDLFHKPGRASLLGQTVPIPLATRTNISTTGTAVRPKVGAYTVVALLGNMPTVAETEGCQVQDLLSIASGFGGVLQHILPRAHHHRLTGLSACLAPDLRYLTSDLCAALMFTTILQLSTNQKTSPSKPADHYSVRTVSGLRPPPSRILVLPFLRQLYEARFDLSLWTRSDANRHWITLDENLWAAHLPYQKHPDDSWPCSASQLFGPNSEPGFQYQHIWRQVLIHDVLAALHEQGWPANPDSPAVLQLLKQFRKTIMASADLAPPSELFCAFRGRQPSHTFLLQAIKSRINSVNTHILLDPVVPGLVSE